MKKLIFFYILFLSIVQVGVASENCVNNWSNNKDAVIEKSLTKFEVKSANHAIEKRILKVTLYNEQSDLNELVIPYSSFTKVKKLEAKLLNANQKVVKKYKLKDAQDYSAVSGFSIYEDSRVKYLNIEYANYPFSIEFSYEIEYTGIMNYPDWMIQPFNTMVKETSYTLILPKGFQAHYQAINTSIEPVKTEQDNQLIYQWTALNRPAITKEAYAPAAFDILPRVAIAPHKFKVDGYQGSMASWETFSNFMHQLWMGKDQLSPKMAQTVQALTKKAGTDKEKIAILYGYLQDNMRYVSVQLGIGGWQPFDANYVERNKYGDCKALTNFMKAMLKEIGIESYPALINSGGADQGLNLSFAYPKFNHVILHIPTKNSWLECTSNSAPMGYIGQSNANRKALLIKADGGVLVKTPIVSAAENYLKTEAHIQLFENGEATVTVHQNAAATQQNWLRYAKENYAKKTLLDKLQEQTSLPSSIFEEVVIEISKDQPTAQINYKAVTKKYCSKGGKRLFVPINYINAYKSIPKKYDDRIHPIVRRTGFLDEDTYTFDLPVGYQVESCPTDPILIESTFGTYSLTCQQQGNQVLIHRKLMVPAFKAKADQYDVFRAFYKAIAKADNGKMVLVKG